MAQDVQDHRTTTASHVINMSHTFKFGPYLRNAPDLYNRLSDTLHVTAVVDMLRVVDVGVDADVDVVVDVADRRVAGDMRGDSGGGDDADVRTTGDADTRCDGGGYDAADAGVPT